MSLKTGLPEIFIRPIMEIKWQIRSGDVLLHKYRYIDYLIKETAKELDQYSNTDE
jgi:hypothetical protein